MVLPRPLMLPAEALVRMVALENLGELHVTLRPPALWRPRQVQHEVETRTRAEFARLGLFDRRGRLDIELVASLIVLCRSGAEFYGWITRDGKTLGVLAAAIGREAILAVRAGNLVSLSQIRPELLPEALVGQTADVPPGRGEAFSLPQSEALASVGGRQAQEIAELPTTGGGQLSVAVRDSVGRRCATTQPLRFADTDSGRWLNHVAAGGSGENRILIAPASRRDLVLRLQEMYRTLTPQHPR